MTSRTGRPERPSIAEQVWGAAGVLIGLFVFFGLVYRFPGVFGGDKDWGFLVVGLVGGTCMSLGGRVMQRAYRRRHGITR